eukprot:TRINITY_DN582_c0_g1_i1.p1 TRINITY_DN582_c0_g1~~TRINITY_DN582_c0_g1_i1.p1  ORF type:complete len:337 (+),score=46.51 TRINITY_DN582_c0_g1_i1:185-1195(+)
MGLTATRIIGRPRTDITDELVCDYDVMKAKLSAMSDENKRKLGLSLVRPKSEIQLKALELINVKLMVDQFYINFRKPKEVPVKLILTDPPGDWGRIRRRIAARIGKILFHGLHAALQIGSTLVDWGSQSLTYPRDVSSSAAIIAIEIGVLRVDDAETCCHKLCTLMAKWNVWETYNLKTRNCQHFVDEALLNLNLPLPTNGVIAQVLRRIRQGKCDKEVPDLASIDPSYASETPFESHVQLDSYVLKLLERLYPDTNSNLDHAMALFKREHQDLHDLLKGFDRAFRLIGDPCLCSAHDQSVELCPFPYTERLVVHPLPPPPIRQSKASDSEERLNV